jgi:hypothetical protein
MQSGRRRSEPNENSIYYRSGSGANNEQFGSDSEPEVRFGEVWSERLSVGMAETSILKLASWSPKTKRAPVSTCTNA